MMLKRVIVWKSSCSSGEGSPAVTENPLWIWMTSVVVAFHVPLWIRRIMASESVIVRIPIVGWHLSLPFYLVFYLDLDFLEASFFVGA